jgi:monofunctional glycosyltransferase
MAKASRRSSNSRGGNSRGGSSRGRNHRANLLAVTAAVVGIVAGLWLVIAPRGIEAYSRGAPQDWAKMRRVHADSPKRHPSYAYVPLSAVTAEFPLAVILGEDAGFLDHGAWDVSAIREAVHEWWHGGGRLRGASTLTQQLAKNLFLSEERSWWRKLREARYAYWLENRLGKRRILELYVNVVELGDGVFGVESAAQHYFGISARALDPQQAAELAASIPSPLRHNPATQTAAWRIRYRAIRERMETITWVREQLLAIMPVASRPRPPTAKAAPGSGPASASPPAGADSGASGAAEAGRASSAPPEPAPRTGAELATESGAASDRAPRPAPAAARDAPASQAQGGTSSGTASELRGPAETSAGQEQ